ncbi:MAG: hypothetical protein HN732_06590 [Rhodospirillaceae bacterium]|nr:hypothetical protein [Rhodospirillaceae bacterium]MBT5194819.1 hypothetical protein [Rhodospirillaceae bacterium]MBT5897155.1 hypothetical protein [Rhodospirillaceae bacterium]MBT7756977.1 hypothetical protein [Rhodospirillaceae bacterium]
MSLDVVLIGAGGSGLKITQIAEDRWDAGARDWRIVAVVDDDATLHGQQLLDYPIVGGTNALATQFGNKKIGVICAVGAPVTRRRIIDRINGPDISFPNAIHPSAQVSKRARMGQGNILCQNVVLQAGVEMGDFNCFNMAAVMGPLARAGDFCTVNAHTMLASGSTLGSYCYVGMGGKVAPRVAVDQGTTIGANAFVHRSPPAWTTVVGLPAKVIKQDQKPEFDDHDLD